MSYYNFEYFCGANTIVRIGTMPLLECAGLAYSINESKVPIYEYSSRHFDAVARGRVLVEGTILVNYVHQDYLYQAIRLGLGITNSSSSYPQVNPNEAIDYMASLGENPEMDGEYINRLKNQFWSNATSSGRKTLRNTRNPHDDFSGVNIRVAFGDQNLTTKDSGKTGILISNVHFLGRGSQITISEDCVVESYRFLARNLHSLNTAPIDYNTPENPDPYNTNFADSINLE